MTTWEDVGRIALDLPGTVESHAHDGVSPAYDVAGEQFARLRWDEGREILQIPYQQPVNAITVDQGKTNPPSSPPPRKRQSPERIPGYRGG